jgi:hypothetical protein
MFVLALKRAVQWVRIRIVSGKIAVLCRRGHNEDRWADMAPTEKVVLALAESTALADAGCVRAGGRYVSALGVGWLY